MSINSAKLFFRFTFGSAKIVGQGSRGYYLWLAVLLVLITIGVGAYGNQAVNGLITSNMRDQLSWGYYIGNFAFLVGIAAAAVVLEGKVADGRRREVQENQVRVLRGCGRNREEDRRALGRPSVDCVAVLRADSGCHLSWRAGTSRRVASGGTG